MAALVQIAVTAILNLCFSLTVGALLLRLLPPFAPDGAVARPSRLSRVLAVCAFSCIVMQAASLWLQAALAAEVPLTAARQAAWNMASGTSYGHAALVAMAAMAALLLCQAWDAHRSGLLAPRMLAIVAALSFGYARASLSHASEAGIMSSAIVVESLHLLSVCTWTGIVALGASCLFPASRGDEAASQRIRPMLKALSSSATAALAILVLSGVFNLFRVLDHPSQILGTAYGRTLSVKLGLVGIAAVLGAFNRFVGFPAVTAPASSSLPRQNAMARLLLVMRLEACILAVAMSAAAALTSQAAPAMH